MDLDGQKETEGRRVFHRQRCPGDTMPPPGKEREMEYIS
jgi:hypothetical protein